MSNSPEDWFRHEIYGVSKRWRLRDWYVAISCRHLLQRVADGNFRIEDPVFASPWTDARLPVNYFVSPPKRTNSLAMHLEKDAVDALWLIPAVREIRDSSFTAKDAWWGESSALLEVDLAGSDKHIREAFSTWLKVKRKERGEIARKVSGVSESDLENWALCMVLAYVDLAIFQKISNVKLTHARVADLIFPSASIDRVGRLRDVTIPHARRIMSMETWHQIASQLGAKNTAIHETPVFTEDPF